MHAAAVVYARTRWSRRFSNLSAAQPRTARTSRTNQANRASAKVAELISTILLNGDRRAANVARPGNNIGSQGPQPPRWIKHGRTLAMRDIRATRYALQGP